MQVCIEHTHSLINTSSNLVLSCLEIMVSFFRVNWLLKHYWIPSCYSAAAVSDDTIVFSTTSVLILFDDHIVSFIINYLKYKTFCTWSVISHNSFVFVIECHNMMTNWFISSISNSEQTSFIFEHNKAPESQPQQPGVAFSCWPPVSFTSANGPASQFYTCCWCN